MNTFEEEAISQFNANPLLKKEHPRIWRIFNGRPSARRSRRIARMESEVRLQMVNSSISAIDWASIDWLKVFQWIAAILGIILLL